MTRYADMQIRLKKYNVSSNSGYPNIRHFLPSKSSAKPLYMHNRTEDFLLKYKHKHNHGFEFNQMMFKSSSRFTISECTIKQFIIADFIEFELFSTEKVEEKLEEMTA